ncbi:hypothetical protein GA707_02500 [Nostocoides sp. F2B08]|uniref:phosphotransferase n=1 Tax=Nostocoides sp. F2B08 TaxID=2653936 RepID=UPI001263DCD1|nr:phosphotransferase [Tetrasphaera sp. F2B08]KAB7746393.1 hypothetical protein GA707_02500 [Tetrasphaera sp. F2B08]
MTATGRVRGFEVASPTLDPDLGAVARAWVADRRPDATPIRTWTHTALYRGPDDVSARVSLELAPTRGDEGPSEDLTLLVRSRGGNTVVSEFPQDPGVPGLETMLDPRSAAEVLSQAVPELSRGPDRHAGLRCGVTLVHHPRTGACVVRYDLPGPDGRRPRQVYAKVYPSVADLRRSAAAHQAVEGRLLHGPDVVVRLPRLLGVDIDTRAAFIESLGSHDTPSAEVLPAEAARVLATLHRATALNDLPAVGAALDVDRVRDELALVRTGWPELAARVAEHVDAAARCLDRSPEGDPVLSHGDFTPSQLLRMPRDVIGLLDLDTLRHAEPAADLGRYLAYASVRRGRRGRSDPGDPGGSAAERLPSALSELYAVALAAYPVADPVLTERVLAHARIQLGLLALRAARRFKDDRVRLALSLLDHAPTRRPS